MITSSFRRARPVTNQVALVLMDNEAYGYFTNEVRGQPWSRALHAKLLDKLADDGCALVVFDAFFRNPREPASDLALVEAMRRQRGVVTMAHQAESEHRKPGQNLDSARPILPAELFLNVAGTNWGVAWLDKNRDLDSIVRRHWPSLRRDRIRACHGPRRGRRAPTSTKRPASVGCGIMETAANGQA